MTTFEKELRKLFDNDTLFENARFIGRSCYGKLDDDLRVRAEFVTLGISNQYDALKISLLNRREGVVDNAVLRFDEVWGVKPVSNPNFREGVHPHLWKNGDKLEWYAYHPSPSDYEKLSQAVSSYLEIFQEPEQEWTQGIQ